MFTTEGDQDALVSLLRELCVVHLRYPWCLVQGCWSFIHWPLCCMVETQSNGLAPAYLIKLGSGDFGSQHEQIMLLLTSSEWKRGTLSCRWDHCHHGLLLPWWVSLCLNHCLSGFYRSNKGQGFPLECCRCCRASSSTLLTLTVSGFSCCGRLVVYIAKNIHKI